MKWLKDIGIKINKVAHILSEEKQARGETSICFSDPDID